MKQHQDGFHKLSNRVRQINCLGQVFYLSMLAACLLLLTATAHANNKAIRAAGNGSTYLSTELGIYPSASIQERNRTEKVADPDSQSTNRTPATKKEASFFDGNLFQVRDLAGFPDRKALGTTIIGKYYPATSKAIREFQLFFPVALLPFVLILTFLLWRRQCAVIGAITVRHNHREELEPSSEPPIDFTDEAEALFVAQVGTNLSLEENTLNTGDFLQAHGAEQASISFWPVDEAENNFTSSTIFFSKPSPTSDSGIDSVRGNCEANITLLSTRLESETDVEQACYIMYDGKRQKWVIARNPKGSIEPVILAELAIFSVLPGVLINHNFEPRVHYRLVDNCRWMPCSGQKTRLLLILRAHPYRFAS